MAFGKSVGLPGMWSVKPTQTTHTITVNNVPHKVKIWDVYWHGNFQGYRYTIDNSSKKYFCNLLTREEVDLKAVEKIQKGLV